MERRILARAGESAMTSILLDTLVSQALTGSVLPFTSTTHRPQSPLGLMRISEHIDGISMPTLRAATRMVSPS